MMRVHVDQIGRHTAAIGQLAERGRSQSGG